MNAVNAFSNKKLSNIYSAIFFIPLSVERRSGSGKSAFLKLLLRKYSAEPKLQRDVYLINVAEGEMKNYAKYAKNTKFSKIDFQNLPKCTTGSVIIVEDIINMGKRDEQILRHSLNYDAHHRKQKIICISHSIHKNSIWSMLPFFHHIVFSSAPSNSPVIRFALNYFKIEKPVISNWIEKFRNRAKLGIYFFFDSQKMTFNVMHESVFQTGKFSILGHTGNNETAKSKKLSLKQTMEEKFEKFVSGQEFRVQAIALFGLLINCIDLTLIREHDLTMAFASTAENYSTIRISLVDYIACLLSKDAVPNSRLLTLHNYLSKLCRIPKMFIINSKFLRLHLSNK